MPTYQTSPMLPVIFPDQAISMNVKGFGTLKARPIARQDSLEVHDPTHSSWKEQAHKEALDRVKNSKKAEEGMLGKLKMNERSQRYYRHMSRSAVPNGKFPSGEYVTSGGLRGGVITTKEGQEWLKKRLNNRIVEYDAIASRNFSQGAPPNISMAPEYEVLDSSLQSLIDSISSAKFDSGTISDIESVQNQLLSVGSIITQSKLADYAEIIENLYESVQPYFGQSRSGILGLDRATQLEYSRVMKYLVKSFKNLDFFIQEIARTMNEDKPARELVVSKLRERLLGKTASEFQAPGAIDVEAEEAALLPEMQQPEAPAPTQDLQSTRASQLATPETPSVPAPEAAPAPAGQGKRYRARF